MSSIPETANKGLENVTACTTAVSTIHDTTLLYRGYTIEDLALHASFEEVIYLLWYQTLPDARTLQTFKKNLLTQASLGGHKKEMIPILTQLAHHKAHPMSQLRTAFSYMGALDDHAEAKGPEDVLKQALHSTAGLAVLACTLSRLRQDKEPMDFDPKKSFAWNILHGLTGKTPSDEEVKLFDTALILHADHELNASAFTARVVTSTQSDYYSAITAAIGALKGSLHGGANEQVMIMLKDIGGFAHIEAFLEDALDAKKKVMGIGHRVYKNGDPRARILKELSLKICEKAGLSEQHRMLSHIEATMLAKKGLMPNVDFYSGLVYTALGLHPSDFTPIFAMSRITGWSAQILEQMSNNRIYRPRAFYTGPVGLKIAP